MEESIKAQLPEGSELQKVYVEIKANNYVIAEAAIGSILHSSEIAMRALSAFMGGLTSFPETMPFGDQTFADFPELPELITQSGAERFNEWMMTSDPLTHPEVMEEVVLRNMNHFISSVKRWWGDLPNDELNKIRKDFEELDYEGKTKWLSTFFNGLQACVFETFVAHEFLGK